MLAHSFQGEKIETYSWKSTIVPEVTLVWEAVANKPELALLYILLDGVEELVFGNLYRAVSQLHR